MVLARWASPLADVQEDLNELIRRTFGDFGSSLLGARAGWSPALDVYTEGDEMHVRLELPGINPDTDVNIEVDDGILTISGERKAAERKEGDGWFRSEMRYGHFERRVALPEGVDPSRVRASYDAGILDVTVPLPEKPKTKVKVEVGTQKQLKE